MEGLGTAPRTAMALNTDSSQHCKGSGFRVRALD